VTTRLKNIVKFAGVAPGETASAPHLLNRSGALKLIPDLAIPDRPGFIVTADDTSVTVTNDQLTEASDLEVYVESWHSLERAFGKGGGTELYDELDPQPFVPTFDGGGAMVDEMVKVTAGDTVTGFLADKLVAGANVSLAILNPGADEDLQVSALDQAVKVSGADTVAAFLSDKIVAGTGVVLTILNPGADEDLQISVSGLTSGEILTAAPITVTGPLNLLGASLALSRADHQHRLELAVQDEGALAGARPTINFIGTGVGAVDNPGLDRVDITITGGALDDDAVIERSQYVGPTASTSSNAFVDGMAGLSVAIPTDGDYWIFYEGEGMNSNANAVLEIGLSIDSVVAVEADSERSSQGNANDLRTIASSKRVNGLLTGQLVRVLFRKLSGAQSVSIIRRRLTIIKVQ